MIGFIRAHGYDPGPTQRPLLAGALTGLLACLPAAGAFVGLGSFAVAADAVLRLPRPAAAGVILTAFMVGGAGYGAFFQRAANDLHAGWMLGMAYGFLLWVAAPVTVLPLLQGSAMAAGLTSAGFLAGFLLWGLGLGVAFPIVHRPLQAGLDGSRRARRRTGPEVGLKQRLLRRPY
jgi:hypothetical protein